LTLFYSNPGKEQSLECQALGSHFQKYILKFFPHRRAAKLAEKIFFLWRREAAREKAFCLFEAKNL
jgi:hypothetical protein